MKAENVTSCSDNNSIGSFLHWPDDCAFGLLLQNSVLIYNGFIFWKMELEKWGKVLPYCLEGFGGVVVYDEEIPCFSVVFNIDLK